MLNKLLNQLRYRELDSKIDSSELKEKIAVKKSYPKKVLEIHNEFDTAADRLLEHANLILTEAKSLDITKISRLKSLGFIREKNVSELDPLIKKAELSKEQIDLLFYYKREYPLHKFITDEQVKEICFKYGLVCGDVSRFEGFVPEKNLREIERFKLKEADKKKYWFIDQSGTFYYLKDSDFTETGLSYCKKNMFYLVGTAGENIYMYPLLTKDCLDRYRHLRDIRLFPIVAEEALLKICAPLKDMDTEGLQLKDGYKLIKHIPDPVVLQPVYGGYLILTAWGDEASDPLVVNEINN